MAKMHYPVNPRHSLQEVLDFCAGKRMDPALRIQLPIHDRSQFFLGKSGENALRLGGRSSKQHGKKRNNSFADGMDPGMAMAMTYLCRGKPFYKWRFDPETSYTIFANSDTAPFGFLKL